MIRLRPAAFSAFIGRSRSQLTIHRTALPYRLYATIETPPAASPPPPPSQPSSGNPATFPNPPNAPTNDSTSSPSPSPRPPPKPPRSLRPLIYATAFLLLGLATGQLFRLTITPPPPPPLDSPASTALLTALHKSADALPIIQSLRADPDTWHEWPAYSSIPAPERLHRLTSGPMAGPAGLAVQRVFWNVAEKRAISVLYFGGALCGWPGVVHGGTTATVMDESLGRVAIRNLEAGTGVTANLELNYRRPVLANRFYVVRAEEVGEGRSERKVWVKGTLEDVEGMVCVEAKGLFVAPKGLKLGVGGEGL